MPEPTIREKEGGFMIVLHKIAESNKIGGQIGGQIEDLTERQKEVIEIIADNPKVSRKKIAEILQINESAVQGHTEALKNKEIIKREGNTRGRWIIT